MSTYVRFLIYFALHIIADNTKNSIAISTHFYNQLWQLFTGFLRVGKHF